MLWSEDAVDVADAGPRAATPLSKSYVRAAAVGVVDAANVADGASW